MARKREPDGGMLLIGVILAGVGVGVMFGSGWGWIVIGAAFVIASYY